MSDQAAITPRPVRRATRAVPCLARSTPAAFSTVGVSAGAVPRWLALPPAAAQRRLALLPGAVALAVLAACGDGDGDNAAGNPPGVTPQGLTLTGTAATGAAIANAPVEARCDGGSLTGTTGADGSFTLALPAPARLPCVLKATGVAGTHYSVATGTGSSARANITPVTSLAVVHLAGGSAATYFDNYGASAAAALTPAAAQASVDAVKATLAAGGVDLSPAGDLLAGPLVPASGGTPGNAYEQALVALAAKLASSGTTLTDLGTALARSSPNAPPTAISAAVSLPADLLLKPKAAQCAALRSGRYRSIDLEDHQEGGGYPTLLLDVDAATLKITDAAISDTTTLVPVAGAPCRFTAGDGIGAEPDLEVVVSGAGVISARYLTENVGGTWRASVLIPEQKHHTLAHLAGEWNGLGYWRASGNDPYRLVSTTFKVDAEGAWSGQVLCNGTSCADLASTAKFSADGSGGFYLDGTSGNRYRVWPYRAGGGELMLAMQDSQGGTAFYTRRLARTLPDVGQVSEGWQFTIVPSGNATASFTAPVAVNPYRSTAASVNAAQKEWVRTNVVNFGSGVTQPETIRADEPLPGFLYRAPATGVVRSDGTLGNVGEWVNLPLRGMGLNAVGIVANNQLVLSTAAAQ